MTRHQAPTPEDIEFVLGALRHQPATKAWLAIRTGMNARMVEHTIEHIRREGKALICSGSDGYWLPRDLAEAEANIERRQRRAITQLETVRGESRLLARLQEQDDLTLRLVSA